MADRIRVMIVFLYSVTEFLQCAYQRGYVAEQLKLCVGIQREPSHLDVLTCELGMMLDPDRGHSLNITHSTLYSQGYLRRRSGWSRSEVLAEEARVTLRLTDNESICTKSP